MTIRSKQQLLAAFRLLVVVMAVVALQVAGVSALTRTTETELSVKTAVSEPASADHNNLVPGPPTPDEAASNMNPDGKQSSGPCAQLSAPAPTVVDNDRRELFNQMITPVPLVLNTYSFSDESPLCGSTAEVRPQLAARFTLVGARPSGTM